MEIDDGLIHDATSRTGVTLRETIEDALRELIRKRICRQLVPDRQ